MTISQILHDRALGDPDRAALTVLGNGDDVSAELTHGALWARAQGVAIALRQRAPVGAHALILHGNDDHYVAAFLGCLIAGIIAVPAFPPDPGRPQQLERVRGILRDARPRVILTAERFAPLITAAIPALLADGSAQAARRAGDLVSSSLILKLIKIFFFQIQAP
jgi:acyl-CoA synthetase (AMP-forming)/AMP-acid ligase II